MGNIKVSGRWPVRSRNGRRVGALGGAALLTLGALLLATGMGSRIGVSGFPKGVPDVTTLDYAIHGRTRFAPLRAAYVDQVLGLGDTGLGQAGAAFGSVSGRGGEAFADRPSGARPLVVVIHPFTNSDFAHAYAIPSVPFVAETDTRSATRQPNEPSSCAPVGGTAWYRFVPSSSMTLQADTTGTNYPAALGVFEGSSLSMLRQVACTTSATGAAKTGFLAIAGESYYFQITGPTGGGHLRFSLSPHPETILLTTMLNGDDPSRIADDPSILTGGSALPDFRSGAVVASPSGDPSCQRGRGVCGQVFVIEDGATSIASVSTTGQRANGPGTHVSISGSGRFVAFDSTATNLVPGDTNAISDVFVHDRVTGRTTRESLGPGGTQLQQRPYASSLPGNGSTEAVLSEDGRYLAYDSNAVGFTPLDNPQPLPTGQYNGCVPRAPTGGGDVVYGDNRHDTSETECQQVIWRDRSTGATQVVTATPSGQVGDGDSYLWGATPDFRYLVLISNASDLLSTPTSSCAAPRSCWHVLLWDTAARQFALESVSSAGVPADGSAINPGISADGRYVSFVSDATNLVPGMPRGSVQTYVHDRVTGKTDVVSVTSDGRALSDPDPDFGSQGSVDPGVTETADHGVVVRTTTLSADGRYVSFISAAALTPEIVARGISELFVHDRVTGNTTLVSVGADGQPGNAPTTFGLLSADGSLIDFFSFASNLVPGDENNEPDGFYRGWQRL